MENEECYVFTPSVEELQQPSRKRRKVIDPEPFEVDQTTLFTPLLRGTENFESVQWRHEIFEEFWQLQEEIVRSILNRANERTIELLESFVDLAYHQTKHPKIPTALLLQGPENSALTGLFGSLATGFGHLDRSICITLTSGKSPNLKTILKYINRAATSPIDGGDEPIITDNRLLNYDLQILHEIVNRDSISRIVLLFEDSEAFDGGLLSDLIHVISSWNDRIPFILLFGIATSIDFFQSKLSRKAIRCLEGRQFEVEQIDIEEIFKALNSGSRKIFFGPGLSKVLIERQRDFIQNPQAFVQALKYAYMTHCFSNPFSIWLNPLKASQVSGPNQLTAIRYLPSFRRFVQQSVDDNQYRTGRKLLEDDTKLRNSVVSVARDTPKALRDIVLAVDLLFLLTSILHMDNGRSYSTWSDIYILAMSNKLSDSVFLEDAIGALMKAKSNLVKDLFESIHTKTHDHGPRVLEYMKDISDLMTHLPNDTVLRSSHDIQHSNLRTTVVAQKVELSRQSAHVTAEEAAYTKIIDKFTSDLKLYFGTNLINPQDLFLHEVFLYDVKSLHREVFMPRPRFAIERALSSPHDYLGCDCCHSAEGGLSAAQPAIATVYQLYLESGSVINTADLWSAFWTIVAPGQSEKEDGEMEREREEALALFSRALAELKYLGMIKNSRKKADHLAKLSWNGL